MQFHESASFTESKEDSPASQLTTVLPAEINPSTRTDRAKAPPKQPFVFDESYLARLREGDCETVLHFDRYFQRALRCKLYGKFNPQLEEDIVQDAIGAAKEKILQGNPRDPARLPAYVFGICHHLTTATFRVKTVPPPTDDYFETLVDGSKSVEKQLEDRATAEQVQQVLRELCPRDREILVDLYYRGMSREQVSAKHGATKEQLRMILFHARRRFEKRWRK